MKKIVALLVVVGLLLPVVGVGAQDDPLFQVLPNSNLNLRACASTDCARVGLAPGGTELSVYAVEGDWYQVLVDGELVWLAGWLTTRVTPPPGPTRAPDEVFEGKAIHLDPNTNCVIFLGVEELYDDLNIILGGDRSNDVSFAFYPPGERNPLTVTDRSTVDLDGSDGPTIENAFSGIQVRANQPYRLQIELDDGNSLLEWYPANSGGAGIFIMCNSLESLGIETTQLPPAAAPVTTPAPARLLEMGETWRDSVTGCNLIVARVADEAGDLALLLTGEGRREARVDVYQPGASAALPLADSLEDSADVMGNPVIIRTWPEIPRWEPGRYRFEIGLGNASSVFGWEMTRPGEYSLLVDCGRPASAAALAPDDAPARMLVTGEIYRDQDTGCNLYVAGEDGEADLYVLLLGQDRREARVALYLPGESTPLAPERRKIDDQASLDEAYIADYFSPDTRWEPGLYRIELALGDVSRDFGWEMTRRGDYGLVVDCDRGASPLAATTPDPAGATLTAPEQILEPDRLHVDRETGCIVLSDPQSMDEDLNLVLSGERRAEVLARVYRPGERAPLSHTGRLDRTLGEDDTPAIVQYYRADQDWPAGQYRLELELDGRVSALTWQMERPGDQILQIRCDQTVSRPTATSPPGRAATSSPLLLEADVMLADRVTGCYVLLSPESIDEDLNLVLSGERRAEVLVRVYRPGARAPLPYTGRLDRILGDDDRPVMQQYYRADQAWPAGQYRLEVELDGRVSAFAWQMERPGDQTLQILCGLTASGPTPTSPAAAAPAPLMLQVGESQRDAQTGCLVRLAPESPDEDLNLLLSGERRAEVVARLYRPGARAPLTYTSRVNRSLGDDDEPIIHQYYRADQDWPAGLYRLELELDGRVSAFIWQMEAPEDQFLLILCERSPSLSATTAPPVRAAGPVRVLETEVIYRDDHSGCDILVEAEGLDGDLNVVLAGDRRDAVVARVFLPGTDTPLDWTGQLPESYVDTGEPILFQYYSIDTPWPDGLYQLEIELDGKTTRVSWRLERSGDQVIIVDCSTPENRLPVATLTPTSTSTPTATATATVTRTPRPTSTPAPVVLPVGRFHRDRYTGCDIQLHPEGLDGDLNFVLADSRQEDVEVRIYRPDSTRDTSFSGRINDNFEENGEPFVWQYYVTDPSWHAGTYRLEVTLDGRTSHFTWELERTGDQLIYIYCDRPAPPTPTPTNTPPRPTPTPTLTPSPTSTPPAQTDLRTGALYLDEATGCDVIIFELPPEQADWKDLWVNRTGELRHEFTVRVWLPEAASPLPVAEEYDDADAGELVVWQNYSPRTDWRNGVYRFEVSMGDASSVLTWRMERAAYYAIRVSCEQQAGSAPSV